MSNHMSQHLDKKSMAFALASITKEDMTHKSPFDDLTLLRKQFYNISRKSRLNHEGYEQGKQIIYLKKHERGLVVSWSRERLKNKNKTVKQEDIMTEACESDKESDT